MRKIREVLRLKWDRGLGYREIANSCSMGRTTVREYIERAERAGLTWPVSEDLDDRELEHLLFPSTQGVLTKKSLPDWALIHKEAKRKGVTLSLLWQEYKSDHPEGYQYAQFCRLYRTWAGSVDPVMLQRHKAGEKVFVDYAGQTIAVTNPVSGDVRQAQLFIAVLGASNYTYAEATWTQGLPDWIGSHVRAFQFYGGVPEVVVPDNLKSGVTSPCRYEPEVNPTYQELARHYQISVLPARVRKPRDKAKVENGVLQAERWILAPLRDRTFFDLTEVNEAIEEELIKLNHRPFQKMSGSRASLFEQLDRPALRPLPDDPYEYSEWKRVTVGPDYHVEVDGCYYSVPCNLIREKVDIRLTQKVVECFHKGVRVASHVRSARKGELTTVKEHMPLSHQRQSECSPSGVIGSAERIGPDVALLVKTLIGESGHPQQGARSSLGIVRLAREYGEERVNNACRRALAMQALSYRSVRSILRTGLDRAAIPQGQETLPVIDHENVRGPEYYN